jgi:hypothetical protein
LSVKAPHNRLYFHIVDMYAKTTETTNLIGLAGRT